MKELLDLHVGETVFFDTSVVLYTPIPDGITAANRDQIPPTDRFENPVIQNCWGQNLLNTVLLETADDHGFPFAENSDDVNSGCSTRLKFEFIHGQASPNISLASGMDKNELYITSFFNIEKAVTNGQKTLYRLTEAPFNDFEFIRIYLKHTCVNKNRSSRILTSFP